MKLGPPKFRRFLLGLLPIKYIHELRDTVDTMHNTTVEILEAKRRALKDGDEAAERQIGGGKDIMSVLSVYMGRLLTTEQIGLLSCSVKANMKASEEDRMPDDEVLGQVSYYIQATQTQKRSYYSLSSIDVVRTSYCQPGVPYDHGSSGL